MPSAQQLIVNLTFNQYLLLHTKFLIHHFLYAHTHINRREFGLERFVPTSLIDGMKRKELRRLVSHFLKLNSQMTGSSTKVLTQLQAKIHYLDIISALPSYGAKCFSTNQRDGIERVLLVSHKFGLSQIAGTKNSVVSLLIIMSDILYVTSGNLMIIMTRV